jgi:chromosome segregation ATPase
MSEEEGFEEIDLEQNKLKSDPILNSSSQDQTNNTSSDLTDSFDRNKKIISEKESLNVESKFYYDFMESNKDFFERIGFIDISNDLIFTLKKETEIKKTSGNSCETCKKEITRFFSKDKFCKFCGCLLCDNCSQLKRQISNLDKLSTICQTCENKFVNFKIHEDFKNKLTSKEFEISELNQNLERLSLNYSQSTDEINKLNDTVIKKKRECETKEEILKSETENLKQQTRESVDNSQKINTKINESITTLKNLDEKKKTIEKEFKDIQRDRENITFEYEKKQNYLQDILDKINKLSMSLKNQEDEFKGKNFNYQKPTGNRQLDMLLKEKMKTQTKNLNETSNSTTIILNPSKVIKEVLKEPLISNTNQKSRGSMFKRFVMYMGSKIFIKDDLNMQLEN